jgi:hypothetical protein
VEDSLNYTKLYDFWLFLAVGTWLKKRQVLAWTESLHKFPQEIPDLIVENEITSIE